MKCQKCNLIPTKEFPKQCKLKDKDNKYLQLVYFELVEHTQEYEDILNEIIVYPLSDEPHDKQYDDNIKIAENKYGKDKVNDAFFYEQLRDSAGDIKLACRYCAGWGDEYL